MPVHHWPVSSAHSTAAMVASTVAASRQRNVAASRQRKLPRWQDAVWALAACGLFGLGAPVSAQPSLKPGLWEVMMKNAEMEAAMKQFEQQLAAMPPAQRAQMEKMMSQKGASIGSGGRIRVCHTADGLRQRGPVSDEPGCTSKTQWAGNGGTFELVCQDGRRGKGEFALVGGDAYRSTIEMTDSKRPGKPFVMEQTGRWVAADCGSLKPITASPPAPSVTPPTAPATK